MTFLLNVTHIRLATADEEFFHFSLRLDQLVVYPCRIKQKGQSPYIPDSF